MRSDRVVSVKPIPKAHILGVHTSVARGLDRSVVEAKEKGCQTWQIFSRNPRGWATQPLAVEIVRLFREARGNHGLGPCIVHGCYLINLAANEPLVRQRSITTFREELERSLILGADYLVIHPGSARGRSPDDAIDQAGAAVREAASGLEDALWKSGLTILIENTAGQGGQIGRSFEEVRDIIACCGDLPLGMCLDTAHSFAAGYDWRSARKTSQAMKLLGETVGFERVRAIHFNDSKSAFGSQVDRHWHIGEGQIGSTGLGRVINDPRLRGLPFILETPEDSIRRDVDNLAIARSLGAA
jgi:deoxyribonuclease IV